MIKDGEIEIDNSTDQESVEIKYGSKLGSTRIWFPKNLDKNECIESTRLFAYHRLNIKNPKKGPDKPGGHDKVQNDSVDQKLIDYAEIYPLPISADTIGHDWLRKHGDKKPEIGELPRPLVEQKGLYVGLAKRFVGDETVGWFIGILRNKHLDKFYELMTRNPVDIMECLFLFSTFQFIFVEGIVLLEGKFDKSVIRQLEDYENFYTENILGELITGRPRYDPEDYLGPARPIIRKYPDILQKDLVKRIGCDERTFRCWRELAGFDTFRKFKNSVLNK